MQEIRYRPVEKKDYAEIGEIINQSFHLFHYVSDRKTLEAFKLQYIYSCLSEATYTCVAEQNGKVLGVVMGQAQADYNSFTHLPFLLKALDYSIKMRFYGRKHKDETKGYQALHQIYSDFSKKHQGEFDGVLTLFAVNEACRGHNIGGRLLSGLFDYFKSQNTKRIYLYTDDTCSYGFYEHKGFQQLEKQALSLIRDGAPFEMDVFLYGYSF